MESVISIDSSTELSDLITELHVSPHSTSSFESSNDETTFQNSNDSIDEREGINFEENEFYLTKPNMNAITYSHSEAGDTEAQSCYLDDDERMGFSYNMEDYINNEKFMQMKKNASKQNLTFSKNRLREIERTNHILLQKLMTKKPMIDTNVKAAQSRTDFTSYNDEYYMNQRSSSGMINRKKNDRKIASENEILKKKLERISKRRVPLWK